MDNRVDVLLGASSDFHWKKIQVFELNYDISLPHQRNELFCFATFE
jgi:hypothetical protein